MRALFHPQNKADEEDYGPFPLMLEGAFSEDHGYFSGTVVADGGDGRGNLGKHLTVPVLAIELMNEPVMTPWQARDLHTFETQENRRLEKARLDALREDCREFARLREKIMLASRAFGLGSFGFQLFPKDFKEMFFGERVTVIPATDGGVRKFVRIEDVEFFCLDDESTEERIIRLMGLVAPDKKAMVVADLMAEIGGKE